MSFFRGCKKEEIFYFLWNYIILLLKYVSYVKEMESKLEKIRVYWFLLVVYVWVENFLILLSLEILEYLFYIRRILKVKIKERGGRD